MKIGTITRYGIFDTSVKFSSQNRSTPRMAERFEFEYLLSCDGASIIDHTQYKLLSNTFLLRKPGQKCYSILHFKCYYFHLQLEENSEYYDMLLNAPNYFQLIDSQKYRTVMEELVRYLFTEPNDPRNDFINAKLLELFYYIRKDTPKNANYVRMYSKGYKQCILNSIQFIQEHYWEKITLQQLADISGYTPNYFHAVFTRIMGVTPQKYILDIRIKNAKDQLASTQKSLSDIAYDCGFSSQSHFNLQFKKSTLLTPCEYRKASYRPF